MEILLSFDTAYLFFAHSMMILNLRRDSRDKFWSKWFPIHFNASFLPSGLTCCYFSILLIAPQDLVKSAELQGNNTKGKRDEKDGIVKDLYLLSHWKFINDYNTINDAPSFWAGSIIYAGQKELPALLVGSFVCFSKKLRAKRVDNYPSGSYAKTLDRR